MNPKTHLGIVKQVGTQTRSRRIACMLGNMQAL